jgi:hypothetical protein
MFRNPKINYDCKDFNGGLLKELEVIAVSK